MEDKIHKIWGERRRVLLTHDSEIDLLYLLKNTFCSTHRHQNKINKFIVIRGKVKIETEFGNTILNKNDEFTVFPPQIHRFFALKDSIMIELAYVKKGKINPSDIIRIRQGGKKIQGQEYTENELREKNMLEL